MLKLKDVAVEALINLDCFLKMRSFFCFRNWRFLRDRSIIWFMHYLSLDSVSKLM